MRWTDKNPDVCAGCFWLNPADYSHIETEPVRRTEIMFSDDEVQKFDDILAECEEQGITIQEYIKKCYLMTSRTAV